MSSFSLTETWKTIAPAGLRPSIRRTKIVCTLGPATTDPATIFELAVAGMDVARLNFSHGSHDEHFERLAAVRLAQRQAGAADRRARRPLWPEDPGCGARRAGARGDGRRARPDRPGARRGRRARGHLRGSPRPGRRSRRRGADRRRAHPDACPGKRRHPAALPRRGRRDDQAEQGRQPALVAAADSGADREGPR